MATYPTRGQKKPNYWDNQLKAWITEQTALAGAGIELAYAENATGIPTTISASVDIPGCMVTIPADGFATWIEYGGFVTVTTPGGGLVSIEPWDITDDALGTQLTSTYLGIVPEQQTLYSGFLNTLSGRLRLEQSTEERIIQLRTSLIRDADDTLNAEIENNPTYLKVVQA